MTFLLTGSFRHSFTNLSTGKAITENVSGPAKVTVFPDGSVLVVAKGRDASFLTPAVAKRFGLPTVSIVTGGLTFSESAGNLTSVSVRHVVVNVCTALS
jgi:hypothetical protein